MTHRFFNHQTRKMPAWAEDFDEAKYVLFRKKLKIISDNSVDPDTASSDGIVDFNGSEINLASLARLCMQRPDDQWDDEIAHWYESLVSLKSDTQTQTPSNISRLRLQLYPIGYFDRTDNPDDYLTREDLPGVLTTIVVELPDKLTAMPKSAMGAWGEDAGRIFNQLLERLAEETPRPVNFVKLNGTEDVVGAILGDENTAASHCLVINKLYPQLLGEFGALVGVPHRHMILVKRLDDRPSLNLVKIFQNMVSYMTQGQPGYISSSAYLLKDHRFEKLM